MARGAAVGGDDRDALTHSRTHSLLREDGAGVSCVSCVSCVSLTHSRTHSCVKTVPVKPGIASRSRRKRSFATTSPLRNISSAASTNLAGRRENNAVPPQKESASEPRLKDNNATEPGRPSRERRAAAEGRGAFHHENVTVGGPSRWVTMGDHRRRWVTMGDHR